MILPLCLSANSLPAGGRKPSACQTYLDAHPHTTTGSKKREKRHTGDQGDKIDERDNRDKSDKRESTDTSDTSDTSDRSKVRGLAASVASVASVACTSNTTDEKGSHATLNATAPPSPNLPLSLSPSHSAPSAFLSPDLAPVRWCASCRDCARSVPRASCNAASSCSSAGASSCCRLSPVCACV